jgi:predicted enzyme related to lactoylglutathione lyase
MEESPMSINLVVYPVRDPARAKSLFTEVLGTEAYVDSPYYVGFRVGEQEVGLDPNGHAQGMTGPIAYHRVNDIRQSVQKLVAAGAQTQKDVSDVGGGKLIAWVKDAEGNVIGLMQEP